MRAHDGGHPKEVTDVSLAGEIVAPVGLGRGCVGVAAGGIGSSLWRMSGNRRAVQLGNLEPTTRPA